MPRLAAELARFVLVGALGLLVDAGLLYLGLWLGLGYYGGRLLSFLAAVWCTWQFNRRYTFRRGGAAPQQRWWAYLAAMSGGGLVNYAAYAAALCWLAAGPWLAAQSVAIGSASGLLINFASAKWLVFKS